MLDRGRISKIDGKIKAGIRWNQHHCLENGKKIFRQILNVFKNRRLIKMSRSRIVEIGLTEKDYDKLKKKANEMLDKPSTLAWKIVKRSLTNMDG